MAAAARLAIPRSDAVEDVAERGWHAIEGGTDPSAARALLARIRALRPFDARLFLSEAEFDADPQHRGVNPRPGRNLLERFDGALGFVEADPGVADALRALLGDGYEVLLKKLICGVPASAIPPWLERRLRDRPVNNLGAYVRPEFRDVTYFYGIDFHQDLIDHPDREADFVTLYVYLDDVGPRDAPLHLLEGSHALGAAAFPHALERTPSGWTYRDERGGEARTPHRLLTGPAGYAALWHACTLHGTQPTAADRARLSLRYLVAKRAGAQGAGLDGINRNLRGPLSLAATRRDLDAQGASRLRSNAVNVA